MSQREATEAHQASQPARSRPAARSRSHPASQAGSRAGSQTGSAAASRPGFNLDWIKHVGWDGEFRTLDDAVYGQLPKANELRDLIKKSLIVPGWMANIESPEWPSYLKKRQHLRNSASLISRVVSRPAYTTKDGDEDLSIDIQEGLLSILHIPRHALALRLHVDLEPMEADRRHPVDTLASLVWNIQSEGLVAYRTERKLAVPCLPAQAAWGEVQPDACALIVLPPDVLEVPPDLWAALSCLPRTTSTQGLDISYALHWVTEFKRDSNEDLSKRQVVEGLVSALYQRRAFGFPNHFVFGTAHHSRTTLEVLAATWVPTDEPPNPGAQEANVESTKPHEAQASGPSEKLPQDQTASGTPQTDEEVGGPSSRLSPKEIKKYNKIVVYSIAAYNMTGTEDILKLYLLMRQTRVLAQRYKNEIAKDAFDRILELAEEAKELYQWPPPPRPKSDPGQKKRKLGGGEYNHTLPPTAEDDCMSIDSDEDFDSRSDSAELDSSSIGSPMGRVVGDG